MTALIEVNDLRVTDTSGIPVLDQVSLRIDPGERVALLGGSGAGKTTLALALFGHHRPGLRPSSGTVAVDGHDLGTLSRRELRNLRRTRLAYLPQNPAAALTPTLRVAAQVRELANDTVDIAARLRAVGLSADTEFTRRVPGELSGGQQQRLALARVLAADPKLLVLDEPTTGLDPAAIELVLTETSRLLTERGIGLLLISHDPAVARRLTDRRIVMRHGAIIDDGPHPPPVDIGQRARIPVRIDQRQAVALDVSGLSAHHRDGFPVLDEVNLTLHVGETLAVVGVSGSGKSTLARCLAGHQRPDSGIVRLGTVVADPAITDRSTQLRQRLQLIPQDAAGSLNPRRRVGAIVGAPLRRLRGFGRAGATVEVQRLLAAVDLDIGFARRFPGQLSDGQRQRVAIACALAADPEVLICDEVTSDLDGDTQESIYRLLTELRATRGLAILMISHDETLLDHFADRRVRLIDGKLTP